MRDGGVILKKIIIDKDKCIGCFRCKTACPTVFEIGDDEKAKVKDKITKDDIKQAEKVIMACPTRAISIENTSIFDVFKKNKK